MIYKQKPSIAQNKPSIAPKKPSIALYQPEIPQNTGTIIRTCAAFGLKLYIIGPCGFIWDNKFLNRSAMDYINHVEIEHIEMEQLQAMPNARLIAATCHTSNHYFQQKFTQHDILLFGPESSGLPQNILSQCHAQITIPMLPNARSLNVSISMGIIASHALLQLNNLF